MNFRLSYIFLSVLCLFSFSNSQSLEEKSAKQSSFFGAENPLYEYSMEKLEQQRSILRTVSPQILESVINPNNYIVGPGDEFNLYLFGEIEQSFFTSVLPEGNLLIPGIGSVYIANLPLTVAKTKIDSVARISYPKSQIAVSLAGLRKFRVHLTGEINRPGTYFLQATDRLADLIVLAEGLTDWADETNIVISHTNGSSENINISQFIRNGIISANPTLRGGDIVKVAAINLDSSYVLVESHIEKVFESQTKEAGKFINKSSTRKIYRLLEDETITGFLSRIGSLNSEIDLSNITLIRGGEEQVLDFLNRPEDIQFFYLKSKDVIIIPDLIHEVYVQGEVKNPGSYDYNVNLTADDYIGRAGVLDRAKNSESVIVVRAGTKEILRGGKVIVEKGDTIIVPTRNRVIVSDYLAILIPVASIIVTTYYYLTR